MCRNDFDGIDKSKGTLGSRYSFKTGFPAAAVELRLLKAREDLGRVFRVEEFPQPVQRQTAGRAAFMVGMGIQTVLAEIAGFFQSVYIKHIQTAFSFILYSYYITEGRECLSYFRIIFFSL